MSEHVQHIKQWRRDPATNTVESDEEVTRTNTAAERTHARTIASRVVWYIAGILLSFLALRFILELLGANPANAFANFVYSVTYPFVYPFFSLFSYNLRYSVAHFELYPLIAMLVYALVAYGIARLINITSDDATYGT